MTRIIVHGGAGHITAKTAHRKGVRRAAMAGHEVLRRGGSALDAVIRAVAMMEDDPTFNCGTGSALSLSGRAEMDAAVMLDDRSCGAVAALERVKNPILVARQVMEQTDHVLLVGQGALKFARCLGFRPYDPVTEKRKKQLARVIGQLKSGADPRFLPRLASFLKSKEFGTVGAVALDEDDHIAVATSTGGMRVHLPGRVGDTPVIGAGTYADEYGGISATGHGEAIIKLVLAATTVHLMESLPAQTAVDDSIQRATREGCEVGLIAVDRKGNLGFGFNTRVMSYAYVVGEDVVVF